MNPDGGRRKFMMNLTMYSKYFCTSSDRVLIKLILLHKVKTIVDKSRILWRCTNTVWSGLLAHLNIMHCSPSNSNWLLTHRTACLPWLITASRLRALNYAPHLQCNQSIRTFFIRNSKLGASCYLRNRCIITVYKRNSNTITSQNPPVGGIPDQSSSEQSNLVDCTASIL